jgi:hypothetical protein
MANGLRIGNKSYGGEPEQSVTTGMGAQAEAEPDVTDPNEPTEGEAEGEVVGAQQGQMSQQQARYRMGSPVRKCGNCLNYNIGTPGFQFGRCSKVQGSISTYGLCDVYAKIKSPWPPALNVDEMAQLEQWYWQKAAEKGIGPNTRGAASQQVNQFQNGQAAPAAPQDSQQAAPAV